MLTTISTQRGRLVIFNLIIIGAILAVYAGIVDEPFHLFDDPLYVTNNYYVQNGLTFDGIAWAFRSLDVANWHPLTWLSHMVDIEVFGQKPAGHYLTNLLWHIAASLLLFRLVYRIGLSEGMAFAVALIWAVHPANVECVAWIAERKTLIASVMMFAGMLFYQGYLEGGGRRYYLLCIVAAILASMAKPVAVLFPVALVLMDGLGRNNCVSSPAEPSLSRLAELAMLFRSTLAGLKSKIPFIAIAGYLSVLTFMAEDRLGATGYTYSIGFFWRCGNALESIFDYSVKSLTMSESSLLYVIKPLDGLIVFLGALLVLLMVLGAVACYRKMRIMTIGLAWFLLMFLPTIGLVQVGSQRLADRYLGWPLIGLICVICYGMDKLLRRGGARILPAVALGAWALGLGLQSRALCVDWEDDLRLSWNAMRIGGRSSSMLINCSVLAVQRNDKVSARRYLNMIRGEKGAVLNLAVVDNLEGKYDDALKKLRLLYSDRDARLKAATLSGQAFDHMGKPGDARRAYKAAINFLPPERTYMLNVEQLRAFLPKMEADARAAEEKLKEHKGS